MTSISAVNPTIPGIHGDFFDTSLPTANKESPEGLKIIFNNEPPKSKPVSYTRVSQSNSFAILSGVHIVHTLQPPEYHYNWHSNKGFIVLVGVKQSNELGISAENTILLKEILSEIESLLKNEYDWDDIGYRKPTREDINRSKNVLTEFVTIIDSNRYSLEKPHISNFEEGGATIKWKIGDRTLYLEIGQNESIVSKVWRESGELRATERPLRKKDYLQLWKWIINEK